MNVVFLQMAIKQTWSFPYR